ncbi:MAG: hypothetical protein U5L08_13790 [Xanthomonadales bacterium]|nr:hypothetical protein [Xanthomonadales bacterium]
MARVIRIVTALFIGSWLLIAAHQESSAQRPVRLPDDPIWIADFGLESQIPSATDLVGPENGPAGQNRAALVHRFQCWIDGMESCSVADRNDPRVRAIRRFVTQGALDRGGAVIVHFPDRTRIEVKLKRVPDLGPDDWGQRVYELVVLPDTARALGQN